MTLGTSGPDGSCHEARVPRSTKVGTMRTRLTLCIPALALSLGIAAGVRAQAPVDPLVAQSPYADKSVISYSSQNGPDGRPIPIPWAQLKPNDFGPQPETFDFSGLRHVTQVPPPGVHPRILFTPTDLPDIRRRLKETKAGQQAWRNILSWTQGMKGKYDQTAAYAQPDLWHGSFGGLHGPVPLFRLGKGGWKSDRYQRLINGDTSEPPGFFWSTFTLEAFRCLVEDDAPGAHDLAKAVMTALKIDQAARVTELQTHPKEAPAVQPVGGFQLAYIYDLLYNWLTPDQRAALHDELAATTPLARQLWHL